MLLKYGKRTSKLIFDVYYLKHVVSPFQRYKNKFLRCYMKYGTACYICYWNIVVTGQNLCKNISNTKLKISPVQDSSCGCIYNISNVNTSLEHILIFILFYLNKYIIVYLSEYWCLKESRKKSPRKKSLLIKKSTKKHLNINLIHNIILCNDYIV